MSNPKRIEGEEGNDKPLQDFPDKRELRQIYEKAFKDMEYMEQYRSYFYKLGIIIIFFGIIFSYFY